MTKQTVSLDAEDHELLLNALCSHFVSDLKWYPSKRWWTKKRQKQAFDVYQIVGQALGEDNIALTWDTKKDVS